METGFGANSVCTPFMAPALCRDHVGSTLEYFLYYSRVMHIHVDKLFLGVTYMVGIICEQM